MKATELMIGDWVLTLDSTHKEKVFAQVDAIEEGKRSILVTRGCSNWFVDIDWIEPIPLTAEILERNGFELRNGFFYHRIDDKPHHYDFKLENGGVFTSEGYTLQCCIYHLTIRYVHELQHALRVCRLDELADNFKLEE